MGLGATGGFLSAAPVLLALAVLTLVLTIAFVSLLSIFLGESRQRQALRVTRQMTRTLGALLPYRRSRGRDAVRTRKSGQDE
jgi:type II secretory pathway component PulJ